MPFFNKKITAEIIIIFIFGITIQFTSQLHVSQKLRWQFTQHIAGKFRVMLSRIVFEGDKLHIVSLNIAEIRVIESSFVAFQITHLGEILVSDTDNKDGQRIRRRFDDFLNGLSEIAYQSV